jgi:multidrug efflux pump
MGSIQLILATGPGAVSRTNLGVVIFAGVSVATFFTLFVVPAFYAVFARHTGSPQTVAKRLQSMRTKLAG